MYIDKFINDKYIKLFRYCLFLNSKNCIIVKFKYGKYNSLFFLRKVYKLLGNNKFNLLLLHLKKKTKVALLIKAREIILKKRIKKELIFFFIKLLKVKVPFKLKLIIKSIFLKLLGLNRKYKIKIMRKQNKRDIKKSFSSYNFINYNVNFNNFIKKVKVLKFLLNRVLKPQVMANILLYDGFLGLNLHSLFVRRFRFRFLKFLKKLKQKFNYNNFHFKFTSLVFKKLVNLGYLYLFFGKNINFSVFNKLLFNKIEAELQQLLNLNLNLKFLNKFKKYIINLKNINYIKCSFDIFVFKRKQRRVIKIRLKKFRKFNFFIFFKLAILKLIIFLFLY
jgi:hypothetical protein